MRSIATCYSEHAIKVSDSYCSGSSKRSKNDTKTSITSQVTCTYRLAGLSKPSLLITLTWHRNLTAGLRISDKADAFHTRLEKERSDGEAFAALGRKFELSWDFSDAKYEGRSPEPASGFYLALSVDGGSALGLLLGDKGFKSRELGLARFALVARTERLVSCSAFYATRARFCDGGTEHEIVVKCVRDEEDDHDHVLCVCVDRKSVLEVKRLRWNFRGNHAIFMDGLVVDVMWDVHDWFFNTTSGCAVFMFRTRSGLNSRLWLEEKTKKKKQDQAEDDDDDDNEDEKAQFSLLICACKKS